MFYLLSKVLIVFTEPIGWFFSLFFISIFIRNKVKKRILRVLSFFILWIFSNGAFTEWAARAYEIPPVKISDMPAKEIGVVLTGGLINDPISYTHGTHIGTSADRIYQAAKLYKAKKIQKILISGGDNLKLPVVIESQNAKQFLMDMGVPAADIYTENKSLNTYQNALFTAQTLTKLNAPKDIILISSASHLPRAIACFKKQNIKAVPFPCAHIATYWQVNAFDFLPNGEEMQKAKWLTKEWQGYIIYKMVGYI
jgi:uncharacterized SAM-binding protein YcdF (DUF218 family)